MLLLLAVIIQFQEETKMPPRGKPGSRSATKKRQQARAAAKKSATGFTPENIKAAAEKRKQQEAKNKKAAARRAATRAANKSRAANKAAMKAAAAPKSLGARILGRALPAAGLAVTGAEIVREASKIPARRRADRARQTAVAQRAEQQSSKVPPSQQPKKGREVLAPAKRAASKYKVKSGDTLSQIAKKNGTTVRAIMKASGIKNANQIKAGQQITIPDDAKRKGPYGKITKKELKSGKYNTSKTPKFGADFSYGGSMKKKTTMKNKGGKIGGAPHNRLY
jgi:LysM repeat protein